MKLSRFTALFVTNVVIARNSSSAFINHDGGSAHTSNSSTRRVASAKRATPAVDSVLYKPSLNLQDEEFDTIIVGSGIGALATAALLGQSRQHHKVLVLEQHYRCGGCCHTFETKNGYSFGTGIHYVGEVNDDTTGLRMRQLLEAITPKNDPIEWSAMPPNYDTVVIGRQDKESSRRYQIYAKENQAKLKEQFPNEDKAIDEYFDLCRRAQKSVKRAVAFKILPRRLVQVLRWTGFMRLVDKGFSKFAATTLGDVINSLPTDNADLKALLCYNWFDYGSPPSETPFFLHSLVTAHYQKGGYYPTGGPATIPRKIIPVITANGGRVLGNAPVKNIVIDDESKAAVGVELVDGTCIRAKRAVISDAGVMNTCRSLVPSSHNTALLKRFGIDNDDKTTTSASHRLKSSLTGLSLFVGLKGDHDMDLQLPRCQLWMYPSASIETDLEALPKSLRDIKRLKPDDLTPIFIGSPSGKDGDWKKNHPGKATVEILTVLPWQVLGQFAPEPNNLSDGARDTGGRPGSHGAEYKAAKEHLAELIWTRARQGLLDSGAVPDSLPESVADLDAYELGTPLTYAHYLKSEKGAFYGLSHDLNRFQPRMFCQELRPAVHEISGLYLTGQDVTACGFIGALSGAFLCAGKVLGIHHPFSLLKEVENNRVVSTTPADECLQDTAADAP